MFAIFLWTWKNKKVLPFNRAWIIVEREINYIQYDNIGWQFKTSNAAMQTTFLKGDKRFSQMWKKKSCIWRDKTNRFQKCIGTWVHARDDKEAADIEQIE